MKRLVVPYYSACRIEPALSQISKFLDTIKPENIAIAPWPQYNYKPTVSFSTAHNGKSIYIKYYVSEEETKTRFTEINEPVYRDSCVEFFISFDDNQKYYNFEFNSSGICRAGFGENRETRELLPVNVISSIEFITSNRLSEDHYSYWDLCLSIPVTVFCHHHIINLAGKHCKANFFKCGDDLAKPHFLTWNNIIAKEPNFHLPEYFGEISMAAESKFI
ncbi:MAG: hypothetical protein H7096_08780 [Flavobacterium sp.]|nr:hypothetical protein [Pedobacter sp.]